MPELDRANDVNRTAPGPRRLLSPVDVVAVVVGIVIGAGIFRTPSIVAANVGDAWAFMAVWLVGGVVSLIGALCYAELAATYPHAGGDYHYLMRALGANPAFLFAWSRMTVIQSGSIAVQAFLIGDYASAIVGLGAYSSPIYAAAVVVLLTGANIAGIRLGKSVQNVLTLGVVVGLLLVVAVGLFGAKGGPPTGALPQEGTRAAVGLAMVFVLLTYGGWNEAAYLSAEVKGGPRSMVVVLLAGIGIITAVYLLSNWAFLHGLGLSGMAGSKAVAADLMRRNLGDVGAQLISLIVVVAALSTMNATIITGARTNYALGRDFPMLSWLGEWPEQANTPVHALLAQGAIALALVGLGTITRNGFVTMVEYTAPVFWFFFFLAGVSLIVLRFREPGISRPFRVPLYPVTPLLFCGVCLYMLQASLAYTGLGAWVGVGVILAGVPLMLLARSGRVIQQQSST